MNQAVLPIFPEPDIELLQGDCLEVMKDIPDGSVDMIMSDPPYGTTACRWDSIIPLEPMWEQLKRVIKKNGAIVLTASQPFTSALVMSSSGWFKYEWVWKKNKTTGFLNANRRPLAQHESIIVFSGGTPQYTPQMRIGLIHKRGSMRHRMSDNYGKFTPQEHESNEWFPTTVLEIKCQSESCVTFASKPDRLKTHPTQKPVPLMEYLIKTYTNESETVLDFCMGSGTTGVACKNLNRDFIGIEKDAKYFEIAQKRINDVN